MGKKKGNNGRGKSSNMQGQGGGSKPLPHAKKQTVSMVDDSKGTPGEHKRDDVNSNQNIQGPHQMQEADPSSSELKVGTGMEHSGESECKALTPGGSISTEFKVSDMCHCTECRGIVLEMMNTHPRKDYYVAKLLHNNSAHAVGYYKMCEEPSGEQKSDVQSSDVDSSTENQSVSLHHAEPSSCHDTGEESLVQDGQEQLSSCPDMGGENWDEDGQEMAAAVVPAVERSSAKENQAACGQRGGEEGWGEEEDPWNDKWSGGSKRRSVDDSEERSGNQTGKRDKNWESRQEDGDRQDRSKRRNEDNHSGDRSGKQTWRPDGDNFKTQDRRRGADNYNRSAGDGGGRGRGMEYKIVKEINGDLFTAPKEWSLAHCVATDMRMGSGIAVSFRQNFKSVGELLDQGARVGQIAVLEQEGRYIYYLVTKKYSTGKPHFDDLVSSLQKMRDHCAEHGVKKLAMPRIGCGLDRLEWRDVKPKIEEIFSGLDITITIYNFNQPEKEEDSQNPQKKRLPPIRNRKHRLVEIETMTALLFFGSEDGSMDKSGEDLDRKFNFLPEYRKERKAVGGVIRIEKRGEVLYGLIVRKKQSDAFSYINFENCLLELRKMVRKDKFEYIGVEAFCDRNDSDTMEKVMTVMKHIIDPRLELYVCWPKEMEHICRENV